MQTPRQELPIDLSLNDYLEGRTLEVALSKASNDEDKISIQALMNHREKLIEFRARHFKRMTMARHARGEFYSDARVRSINAMGTSKAELEKIIQDGVETITQAKDVLKHYALSTFGYSLALNRDSLSMATEDIKEDLRQLFDEERLFAKKWIDTIADPSFSRQVLEQTKEAAKRIRTSSRSMFFVSRPEWPHSDQLDVAVLGRAWSKLDALALSANVKPLSEFIGLDDEPFDEISETDEILVTVEILLTGIKVNGYKIASKKATVEALTHLKEALTWVQKHDGKARFEIDM